MRRLALVVGQLVALVLAACAPPVPPRTVTLSYASPYPATHPFSRADIAWMHFVETRSGGHIRIKPYWGGALLSSNENMLEIRHGVADIGLITPMYARSAHLQRRQPSFYSGVGDIADQIAVYKCLAAEFPALDSEVVGIHVLAVQGGNFPGILTRNRPVRSLADLRGLRLRAQEDTADVLRALGADPVNMSMADVYPAMAKGVIDGVVTPADALRAMHLAEVGHYFSTLKISRGAYPGRAISATAWARLGPADRALLTRAEPVWEAALVRELDKSLAAGLKYAHGEGIEFVAAAPGTQDRFDRLYLDNAVRLAGSLQRYGIDGAPIARRAAELIATRNAGGTLTCGAAR